MKSVKLLIATLIFTGAFNFSASAQTADDENTVALTNADAPKVEEMEMAENAEEMYGELNVWPKQSSIKVMLEIEDSHTITIKNLAGITVKEMQLAKGQSINVESLLPGTYTIYTDDKRKGTFIKK